jgi:predicted acylesterase/phospholipase RssA
MPSAEQQTGMSTVANEWTQPLFECDIVMKGGITSGIVYPGAVVELARRYRFRQIGGASAGAIAAAAVAAAEYGRETSGGFARLHRVPGELAEEVNGDPLLLRLFRPERTTRPLFDSAIAFLRHGALRGVLSLLLNFWRFPVVAASVAALAVVLAVWADVRWPVAIAAIAAAPWIAALGLGRDIVAAFGALKENDFGLCRLGPGAAGEEPLTVWLHRVIQEAAGKPLNEPLTFTHLWAPPLRGDETQQERDEHEELIRQAAWDASQRRIDLQVMTTNLTHGRPMRLPIGADRFTGAAEDGDGLLFDSEEWLQFFPRSVVDHMAARAEPLSEETQRKIAAVGGTDAIRRFPVGGELPVVVAARMSLSFPVLISTVPLMRLRYGPGGVQPTLERVVFSDGGISSNFPVHFFDSPLPTRPTFALNLTGFERGETPDPQNPGTSVEEPRAASEQARERWKDIGSMGAFFVAIKDAMQNWRDNAQSRLPGFRDRIAHIKLATGEGGLNLAMKADKISELNARGAYAGERLTELFSGEPRPTERWNDHRYTRLRVTLSVLDQFLRSVERGYAGAGDDVTMPYADRLAMGGNPPYPLQPRALLDFAIATIDEYVALAGGWGETTLADENLPHPRAVLRIVPPV